MIKKDSTDSTEIDYGKYFSATDMDTKGIKQVLQILREGRLILLHKHVWVITLERKDLQVSMNEWRYSTGTLPRLDNRDVLPYESPECQDYFPGRDPQSYQRYRNFPSDRKKILETKAPIDQDIRIYSKQTVVDMRVKFSLEGVCRSCAHGEIVAGTQKLSLDLAVCQICLSFVPLRISPEILIGENFITNSWDDEREEDLLQKVLAQSAYIDEVLPLQRTENITMHLLSCEVGPTDWLENIADWRFDLI